MTFGIIVDFVVLLADALEILLPLKCYHWPFIFDVLFNELQYRQISAVGNEVSIQLLLNLPFLLSQRKIIPLAFWNRISMRQLPTANGFPFPQRILILVFILTIFSLALPSP